MMPPENTPEMSEHRLWEGEISAESEGSVVDTLLCYIITRSSYTGGAHGIYGTECYTYSLAGGYEITTADLFTEAQLERLNELIRKDTNNTKRRMTTSCRKRDFSRNTFAQRRISASRPKALRSTTIPMTSDVTRSGQSKWR